MLMSFQGIHRTILAVICVSFQRRGSIMCVFIHLGAREGPFKMYDADVFFYAKLPIRMYMLLVSLMSLLSDTHV